MRKAILIIAIAFTVQIALAQTKIRIDSISHHMGQQVQISSKVYGEKALDKVTFINLGAATEHSINSCCICKESIKPLRIPGRTVC